MIRYVIPAAVAAFAMSAALAHAQTLQPRQPLQPMALPTPATVNPAAATNASATIVGQPQPGPNDYYDQGYVAPVQMPAPAMPPISPRTTWIPGHYNWDPNISNYVWTDGQYIEAPRENAQWMPGHWMRTETSWVWVDGAWH